MLPFVIVLDLDGTIVGDVTSHITEWIICKEINPKMMPQFNRTMQWSLRNSLLRPFFGKFMDALYSDHGFEVFVYTASTKDWAPVVVANVEKVIGRSFNRPIFSRDSCVESNGLLKKSLQRIKPVVFQRLRRKYAGLTSSGMLDGRMVLVDNTDVLLDSERWAWIACPTYDYVSYHDVLKHVDWDTLRTRYSHIHAELLRQEAMPRAHQVRDFDTFMASYYSRMSKSISQHATRNTYERNDTYWRRCADVLVATMWKLRARGASLTPSVVRGINRVLHTSGGDAPPAGV